MKNYEERLKNGETLTNRELSIYYNYKYPREKVRYWGRGLPGKPNRIECDVSNFIQPCDDMVKDIVFNELGIKKSDPNNDAKAEIIQKYVIDNITYVSDKTQHGFVEFWQFCYETIQLRDGDCEDGAILMASMLIAAGIPRWRVRIAGGLVKTGNPTAPMGGHAWCCYLRESDSKFIILDWCYYPDTSPIHLKSTVKMNKNYIKTWFSWNDKFTWGNKSFDFDTIASIAKKEEE